MCMLTFYPSDTQPDVEALFNGTLFNQDGHGFAIATPRNGMIVRHGLKPDHMIETFAQMRKNYPVGPALFHSRFGTAGVYGKYNCHPFRFGGDRLTVVGHNGVLPTSAQPGKKDRRCDTRKAADDIFPYTFGHLNSPENRESLANWLGKSNKLVILTLNPMYDRTSYIINEPSGKWDDTGNGPTWYSNEDYQDYRKIGGGTNWWDDDLYAGEYKDDRPDKCPECGCPDIGKRGDCYHCGICVECRLDYWETCVCTFTYADQKVAEQAAIARDLPAIVGKPTSDELKQWVRELQAKATAAKEQKGS